MNREWAGEAMLQQAETEKRAAAVIIKDLYETTAERHKAFKLAGKKYIAAAGLYGRAISNFDKASSNYDKMVKICARIGDIDDKATFQNESVKARAKGTAACRQAAVVCESAAAVCNGDIDDIRGAASATQSAAGWWERLATR